MFIVFHAVRWFKEGFICFTWFNFVPACGPGTGTDPS